ncbi:hypothetical protein BN14_09940 [Rhizoctonia solani AG-1 IB]|uniref:Uncharacterized protein n=1 Tax=Thanatephorus cucumeris (strain AG1-IB / isolate 7/3/14) TaxID=1108050 RepID=M5C9S3_THACB|nr:hypothetical protein BN14_09940 [Rhizoctonia solani AG-1 IB]
MSLAATRPQEPFSPGSEEAENWDDDFLFQAEDSPAKPQSRRKDGPSRPADRRWSGQSQTDTLAWDEELEREEAEHPSSVGSSSLGQTTGATAAVDLSRWAEGDEEDDAEFGFATRRESEYVPEDTVSPLPVFPHNSVAPNTLPSPTKRARAHSPSHSSTSTSRSVSARSSPLMPTRQVPGSPAMSLFSTSTSTAQPYTPSLAGSTAHLRHTRSREASSPVGSFVPAQPRVPRRRLRKKSRPARPGDIAEDEPPTSYVMREPSPQGLGLAMDEEASWSEGSSPQERTPSPVQSPVASPSSPPTKSPLLSRIGSLKNRLNRRPKPTSTPPSSTAPTTPGRTRAVPTRTSTTPQTPRPRAPSWFRPSQSSSPEDQAPTLTHRRSKEPFWKNVGSFSSGKSPVDPSEGEDHESTVKKPPRKSKTGPPMDVFPQDEQGDVPSLPAGPSSPTPTPARLPKGRRPMSMGIPNRPSAPAANWGVSSLGRGTGLGWVSAMNMNDAEEKEKENSILRSLRKLSGPHGRKRSGDGIPRVPSSSAGTSSSRVPSSSNMSSRRPSLSTTGVARTASMSSPSTTAKAQPMLKSASAIVLSTPRHQPSKEFNPAGSVFTLPIAMDEHEYEHEHDTEHGPATIRPSLALERPSLTVEPPEVESPREVSFDRPGLSLDLRPLTPNSSPASPLVATRPLTPQLSGSRPVTPHSIKPPFQSPAFQSTPQGARVMTPYSARPSSPLATRNPTTPLNRTQELTPEEEDEFLDGLEPVPEGDISRYNALDESAQQDWLDAVAALPTPEPDFSTPPKRVTPLAQYEDETTGRVSMSSNSNGRPSFSSMGRKSSSTESGYRHSNSISSRSKMHRKSSSLLAHGHTKSVSEPNRLVGDLLPPIELQPPSPPQTLSSGSMSLIGGMKHSRIGSSTSPMGHSSSLSRAATQPGGPIDGNVLRRNSLSDLKIPARISKAQSGLKSNLGMVREFATCIEQIRGLQSMYRNLLADLRYAIENGEPLSPVLFPPASRSSATSATLVRVPSRDIGRVTDKLNTIDDRYSLWWECADILVELGGGSSGNNRDGSDKPSGTEESSKNGSTKSRERAITLAGNQAAPAVEPQAKKDQWYKDRGELSPRQLQILREMLSTPNPSLLHVPASGGYLNALHPGGTASAITLPSSSGSSHVQGPKVDSKQKPTGKIRRASRAGITGIRDLLKYLNLKKLGSSDGSKLGADSKSQLNLGLGLGLGSHSRVNLPQAAQSQLNLASSSQTHLPRPSFGSRSHGPAGANKSSPRRPSLASIFRLNGAGRSKSKGRVVSSSSASKDPTPSTSAAEDDLDESDWDRMDSASDLDLRGKIPDELFAKEEKDATLRGRKSGSGGRVSNAGRPPVPALPAEFAKSTISLMPIPSEEVQHTIPQVRKASGGKRPPIALASGSDTKQVEPGLRSAPINPEGIVMGGPMGAGVEGRLALTPETIKPLLEYAREVIARLGACVNELRELGAVDPDKLTA